MKLITTMTGSLYEVDEEQKRVRRLHGVSPPTERQGRDEEWRDYVTLWTCTDVRGTRVIFDWAGDGRCTITGPIASMTEPS